MANPRPDREPETIQLPVINISRKREDDDALGKTMLEAATRYGFFYIDGDVEGADYVSVEDVNAMFELVCIIMINFK